MKAPPPSDSDPPNDPPDEKPDVGDIPNRPKSPAVIRFLGCDAEMAGLSTDYFTAGRAEDCDLKLPVELRADPSVVLRFSRGAEGWRVSPSESHTFFVNQEQVRGLTALRSGDVIRFVAGGAGMQFNIAHQNATPLANLVAKYAPRLLSDQAGKSPSGPIGDDSIVSGVAPLRYKAGAGTDAGTTAAPRPVAEPEPSPRRLDPAVLVAGAILLAGVILGAAVLYTAPSSSATDPTSTPEQGNTAPPPAEQPSAPEASDPADDLETPDGSPVLSIDGIAPREEPRPPAPAEPPPEARAEPEPIPSTDPEALDDDPFGL